MNEWPGNLQGIIDEIDICIREKHDAQITLGILAKKFCYSECYFSRKFHEISGMHLRDYLRYRRLAFALKQVHDRRNRLLDIALDAGFSSHEAFTRAFKETYGISPSEYRKNPVPVALRTIIRPFDCYLAGSTVLDASSACEGVKTYFVTIPAHKFLHIQNYESIGYWDFWQRQSQIPGQDFDTICHLLRGVNGKLDDVGGSEANASSGQIMAYINDPMGRICSWGIPLAECYGVRLPMDFIGETPSQMLLIDVPEAEYIVFEHGPFDFETENGIVEEKIERAMRMFDYSTAGYHLDLSPGRVFYFLHDCTRFWKYIRPVKKERPEQ